MTLARLPLITQACGLLLVAGLAAQAAFGGGADEARGVQLSPVASEPLTSTVRIASFNTEAGLSTSEAVSDITRLAGAGTHVIALQEMGSPSRRAAVREALVDCSNCPFEAYFPVGAPANATPILYRWQKFRLEGTGSKQVTERTYVGPRGAGPSWIRAKYVNYVQLRDRETGQAVYVLNNHAVPSVQAKDGGSNGNTRRLAIYRKHMDGLKTLVSSLRASGAAVFVTGDLNVNYRKDRIVRDRIFPFYNMKQVSTRASYWHLGEPARGTHVLPSGHSTRLIDYVYITDHPAVTAESQRILLGYNSDHRPVLVDVVLGASA